MSTIFSDLEALWSAYYYRHCEWPTLLLVPSEVWAVLVSVASPDVSMSNLDGLWYRGARVLRCSVEAPEFYHGGMC